MNRTGHSVRRQPASPIDRRRRGTITIELLLNLPIWLLAILALVEFGEVAADLQSVSMASRVGAEEALANVGASLHGRSAGGRCRCCRASAHQLRTRLFQNNPRAQPERNIEYAGFGQRSGPRSRRSTARSGRVRSRHGRSPGHRHHPEYPSAPGLRLVVASVWAIGRFPLCLSARGGPVMYNAWHGQELFGRKGTGHSPALARRGGAPITPAEK